MTHAPRDWFAEGDCGEDEHPVDEQVRGRLGRSLLEIDARILDLKKRLTDATGADDVWLELEALLNARASLREAGYYNLGVDQGRAHRALEELLGDESPSADPPEALRTLSEHMEVRATSSAEQALVALRQEDFDLILTDLQLGGRDGLWLLGEARRIRPAARRVLMSASDVDADALTASGLAHAFVPKTAIPAALMPTLMRVLAWPR